MRNFGRIAATIQLGVLLSDSVMLDSKVTMPRGGFMAWLICLSAGLFFFYEFFQLNIFDVINPSLRADFEINALQLSWMSSMYLWADILFLIPAGIILDRYSTYWVIIIAMSVCVLGTLGFALTHSFAWASFFHFLSGIGNAFCFLACVVLVSRWFPPRRQALVIGSIVTMAFLGGMMAHTPFAILYNQFGWRNALLIDAAMGAFLLFWIAYVIQDKPIDTVLKTENNKRPLYTGLLEVLGNRQTWLAGLYTSFLNLPIMVLCALWGASYLHIAHQLSDKSATNIVSLIFVGSILGCPLVGYLSDRQGKRKPVMIIGAVITLISLLPLFLGADLSALQLSLVFFALGFFTSTQVISYPFIAESNASENIGIATGVASVLIMGGAGIGQVVFGLLMQHHAGAMSTQYVVKDFQFAMWMFPVTALLALLAVLLMRETHCKRWGSRG